LSRALAVDAAAALLLVGVVLHFRHLGLRVGGVDLGHFEALLQIDDTLLGGGERVVRHLELAREHRHLRRRAAVLVEQFDQLRLAQLGHMLGLEHAAANRLELGADALELLLAQAIAALLERKLALRRGGVVLGAVRAHQRRRALGRHLGERRVGVREAQLELRDLANRVGFALRLGLQTHNLGVGALELLVARVQLALQTLRERRRQIHHAVARRRRCRCRPRAAAPAAARSASSAPRPDRRVR
jgi:hypothetical protein